MSAHHKEYSNLRNDDAIFASDKHKIADARIGSENLLKALDRYYRNRAREQHSRA